ncbi:ABC transporter [Emericellopsis atlantica]|uniref:ABC transporter n=1 Tax=Emericellopsis atlantica TaxID=2614577 RepID=A0A9P7ZJU8_9HYPO|nr:ABC transporter [Emericellopsis atlantica]KAG9253072.1 ABC transporter [Emericellopsis atlantica]
MACLNDNTFGPAVRGCRGDFDFTQRFEEIVLALVPAAILIGLGLVRCSVLLRQPKVIEGRLFQWLKIVVAVSLTATQLGRVVLTTQGDHHVSSTRLAAEIVQLFVYAVIIALSHLQHARSQKPSMILEWFLSATIFCDITRTRTLWLAASDGASRYDAHLLAASTALKVVLLLLESRQKSQWQIDTKERSPEETSGFFSLSGYAWLNRLLFNGYRRVLDLDDLYVLDEDMTTDRLRTRSNAHFENQGASKYWLTRKLFHSLLVPTILPVVPRLAMTGFTFCQPFLIEALLDNLQSSSPSLNSGYALIGATFLVYVGIAISNAIYFYWQERMVTMMRGLLVSAIYRKTIALPTTAVSDSAALTLMNADIERITIGFKPLHEYWANTIEVGLACWLLQAKIGNAFVAPIVVVTICIILTAGVASVIGKRQREWMTAIEARVAATSSMLANMKPLQISGMLSPVQKMVHQLRLDELRVGSRWRYMLLVAVNLAYTPETIGPLMAFAFTDRTLGVIRIFSAMAYITLLTMPLSRLFQDVPKTVSAFTCLGRIQAFLDLSDRVDARRIPYETSASEESEKEAEKAAAVQIVNGSFGWSEGTYALRNVDLKIPSSSLTVVLGPVASGKSTLLRGLLGETPFSAGTVHLSSSHRSIAYCDQEPCLSTNTLRANIIGQKPFDAKRYQRVLHATALHIDVTLLPNGDETRVGSSGATLSGGQKQRVALARALYMDAGLLLLDDILSGLDASTAAHVFRYALGPQGLLSEEGKTTIFCTHDERYVAFADTVVVLGEGGVVAANGTFDDLASQGYFPKVKKSAQELLNEGPPTIDESSVEVAKQETQEDNAVARDASRKVGDFAVYRTYFSSMSLWVLIVFVFACVCDGFIFNFPNVWLKIWSEDVASPNPAQPNAFYIGIYGLLQVSCLVVLTIIVLLCTQTMISQSGLVMHASVLHAVCHAPLAFLGIADRGVIINLFAQDMTLIDSELPISLINFTANFFGGLGAAAVIASSSPWLAISYPLLFAVLWAIQMFYLRTSRQIRLLDLEAKSPLFTHFMDTIAALPTIRAHGQVEASIVTNDFLLNRSQRPAYLLYMIQRWLQIVLRFLVAGLATVVVALATQTRANSGLAGATLITLMNFGDMLASMVIAYTQLETSIGAVARLRSFASSTPVLSEPENQYPPEANWPQYGNIKIENVSASYKGSSSENKDELALKSLTMDIRAGERVALCGRTGSGKSSLVLLLLRLLDPMEQSNSSITVDDLELTSVARETVRKHVIAVSQDPIFLPPSQYSTIRTNLDPYEEATDDEIHEALRRVNLNFLVSPKNGDLHKGLDEHFSIDLLSQGQRQLFSFARAVVRQLVRGRHGVWQGILLLDEISSSVDQETDEKMWKIIEDVFKGYTTIIVAHRLDWAAMCDRVVVMRAGQIAEVGAPMALIEQEGGMFKELWDAQRQKK